MQTRLTVYRDRARREARAGSTAGRVRIAEEIAQIAYGDAPVLTGAYRAGISSVVSGDMVSVIDTDPDAVYKEYGTSDTPAHASLTNAARRFGRYSGWSPR